MMTRNQKANRHKFCSEPLELVENYMAAKADDFEGWCMHHRREIKLDGTIVSAKELIDQNLYYGRPAEELVFMRREEHISLHSTGKHLSAETRRKLSEALKGKHRSAETCKKIAEANKGKHHSEESRKKMSMSLKGFYKGTRWWNNGIYSKRCRECPGPEWKRGRI